MNKVLMVAYHFPPLAGSSGIQRTLRFAQHLPAFGWEPLVLSASPRAYERTSADLMSDIPPGMVVRRALALDTSRHLAIKGRYIGAMARPDRWVSWRFDAVRQGMDMIRRYRPDAIWSTYPIATAHLIGAELHRRSGLPWIADFRDPMAQEGYPSDPKTWAAFAEIERTAMDKASVCTFTTPGAARLYAERYPQARARIELLENGYDEESFAGTEGLADAGPLNPDRLTLLHSGIVYPEERDPSQMFEALARLRAQGRLAADNFVLRLRAPVHVQAIEQLANQHGVQDLIEILPAITYREALAEMLRADALLVLQAANCNDQIPAKIYEYLRSGRPMICLTDPMGDTGGIMRAAGLPDMARLDSANEIAALLPDFLDRVRSGCAPRPSGGHVQQASRQGRAQTLAQMLTGAIATPHSRRSR